MEELIFKRPQFEDRELISSYFWKYPSRDCDRTFANTYLWARFYNSGFAIVENTLVFQSDEEGMSFSFPAGEPENVKKAIQTLRGYSERMGQRFYLHGVTPEEFELLESLFPDTFKIEYERDYADYVYETEKLATLSGKKLHGKRNHINKFKATYEDWSYETLSEENQEECFQMALKWREENGCEDDEEKNAEMCVTLNSLRMFRELGMVGGVLRVNGKIAAFTLGEPVCEDTFVVHIEKAFADIEGAYPMINQQFVQHECMDYLYINREDDAGSEGLRKAKLSYRPAFMVEKGFASVKGQI